VAYWVWVFGEIEGLRWVVKQSRMAFPAHAATRPPELRLATGRFFTCLEESIKTRPVISLALPAWPPLLLSTAPDAGADRGRDFSPVCPIRLERRWKKDLGRNWRTGRCARTRSPSRGMGRVLPLFPE
jgi:hypothetical protein